MSRKGITKKSFNDNYEKIQNCLQEGKNFRVFVDYRRNIKVLTDEEYNKLENSFSTEISKKMYYLQNLFISNASDFKQNLSKEEVFKMINLNYSMLDNDLTRKTSKKENLVKILKTLNSLDIKVNALASKHGLEKEDIDFVGKNKSDMRRDRIIIKAGTYTFTIPLTKEYEHIDVEDYTYFKGMFFNNPEISGGSIPTGVNSNKELSYVKFVNEANDLVIKTYEKLVKMLLSELKK